MRITISVELPDGKRAEFERESEDMVLYGDGFRRQIEGKMLSQMWLELVGEVGHWVRYREPAEDADED